MMMVDDDYADDENDDDYHHDHHPSSPHRDASWETPCTVGSGASITFNLSSLSCPSNLWFNRFLTFPSLPAITLFFGMAGLFWCSPYLLVTGEHFLCHQRQHWKFLQHLHHHEHHHSPASWSSSWTSWSPGGAEFEPLPHHLGISLAFFIVGNWLHHSADVQVPSYIWLLPMLSHTSPVRYIDIGYRLSIYWHF